MQVDLAILGNLEEEIKKLNKKKELIERGIESSQKKIVDNERDSGKKISNERNEFEQWKRSEGSLIDSKNRELQKRENSVSELEKKIESDKKIIDECAYKWKELEEKKHEIETSFSELVEKENAFKQEFNLFRKNSEDSIKVLELKEHELSIKENEVMRKQSLLNDVELGIENLEKAKNDFESYKAEKKKYIENQESILDVKIKEYDETKSALDKRADELEIEYIKKKEQFDGIKY